MKRSYYISAESYKFYMTLQIFYCNAIKTETFLLLLFLCHKKYAPQKCLTFGVHNKSHSDFLIPKESEKQNSDNPLPPGICYGYIACCIGIRTFNCSNDNCRPCFSGGNISVFINRNCIGI